MTTLTKTADLAPLSESDAVLARQSGSAIAGFIDGEEHFSLTLTGADGRRLEATVPTPALRVLAHVLEEMARGRTVTLIPRNAELTTHQAADLLNISRPHLIKQLEAGRIPYRRVGTHRRIRYDELMAYVEREREERRKVLDELVRYSEEIGLYDLEDK
jgi:excisionase family DNA binding protein